VNNREIINYVGIHVTKVTTITDAELRKYKNFLVVYRNWWTLWTKYIFYQKRVYVFTKKEYITAQLISPVQRQQLMLTDSSTNLIIAISR